MGEQISRMVALLLAILRTRMELVSVEFQEEVLRLLSYLLFILLAFVSLGMMLLLGVVLILALCWAEYRYQAIVGLMVFFGGASLCLGVWVRNSLRNRPKFLQYSREEIARDLDALKFSSRESRSDS